MADSTFSFDLAAAGAWDGSAASADALLVERLRAGEDRAYEELLTRFQQPVYNIVYRLIADNGNTADVVQEVFLNVFRSIGAFRAESSLKTWVYRIAVNGAHNHRRWFTRRRGLETGLEDDQGEGMTFEQTLPDHGPSPFELASDQETRVAIEAALQGVRPAFRDALVLREIEGLSYEEIAEVLQANLNTVKTRIVRGRQALREQLAKRLAGNGNQQHQPNSAHRSNAALGAA
ncbi:MAG: sigma-70 family RNA polymerase sigma factor [Acidobacteria bacterium]|nr:sigma-70 family RNA polymerase sigma factor [Acidobacteriota bacterium]